MIINCIIYELLIARMMFRGIEILIILTFFLPQDMLRLLCFSFLLVGGSSTQQHKVCHPNTALQPCYFLSLPWKKVVDFVACCMSFICFKGQIWLYIYIHICSLRTWNYRWMMLWFWNIKNAFGSSEFWGNPSNYFRTKNQSMWGKPFALKHQDIGGTFNARMSLCKMWSHDLIRWSPSFVFSKKKILA